MANRKNEGRGPLFKRCVYCGAVTYFAPHVEGPGRVFKCGACGAPLVERDAEPPSGEASTCASCGKKSFPGEANRYYGKEYCDDCYAIIRRGGKEVYARCAGCGAPLYVEDQTKVGDYYYCDECLEIYHPRLRRETKAGDLARNVKCDRCGKYFDVEPTATAAGSRYCPACRDAVAKKSPARVESKNRNRLRYDVIIVVAAILLFSLLYSLRSCN